MENKKSFPKILFSGIGIVLFIAAAIGLVFYTKYMQIVELGKNITDVFWTNFNLELISFSSVFAFVFLILIINFIFIRRQLLPIDSSFQYLNKSWVFILVHFILSLLITYPISTSIAEKILPYSNSTWFGLGDPIFHQDVGYYIFQRPLYMEIVHGLLGLCMMITILTVLSYFFAFAYFDFYNMKKLVKNRKVIIHIVSLIILYFVVKATEYRFIIEEILFKENKEFFGASYKDISVWMPYYRIAPAILIGVVIAAIIFLWNKRIIGALISVSIYPLTLFAATILATAVQTLVVAPNEVAIELPYLKNNIEMTRAAYHLNDIQTTDFTLKNDLKAADILSNSATIDNIRLTDFNQTLIYANQLQTIKNYYQITDMDIMTYDINGKKTAVSVGARELNSEKLDDTAKNYINMKMRYTHGAGVVMNPVNRITEQGQPYMLIKDIPPRSIEGAPDIKEPRIYFGEQSNDYAIVNTKDKEVDDIEEEGYSYQGSAGIQLNFLNRLLYSFTYGDFKMLISNQINSESKLLINRNILERVKKAAPFLSFDQDPTIIIDGQGKLKWVVDGYTSTKWFPYAQRSMGDYNYIRNSVKVVVDAYDGTMKFYVLDHNEPIINSYERIYPTLFESGDLPEDIASHIRYPEKLFTVQAEMLKKYHMTDPQTFSQKREMWAFSKEKYETDKVRDVAPYYTVMKLQGEETEELILMIPYTIVNKDNMISWLAVRCESPHYGEMVLYHFPQNENTYGIYQMENKVDNDPSISQDLTLWSQGGSNVIRGNMLVLPVKNSLLYIEPIYITSGATEGALPEIKRIIVGYGDKIVSKPTLNEALNTLFGVKRPEIEGKMETLEDVINRTIQVYAQLKESSGKNDWESFGKSMKQLDETVAELNDKMEEANAEKERQKAEINEGAANDH